MKIAYIFFALIAFLGQSYASESDKLHKSKETTKPAKADIRVSMISRSNNNHELVGDRFSTENLIAAQEKEIISLKKQNMILLKKKSYILDNLKKKRKPINKKHVIRTIVEPSQDIAAMTEKEYKLNRKKLVTEDPRRSIGPMTKEEDELNKINIEMARNTKAIKQAEEVIKALEDELNSEG